MALTHTRLLGCGQNVKSILFSEYGHVVYQIKGNKTYDNTQANVLPLYTHTGPLGWVKKGKRSEYGHVAYLDLDQYVVCFIGQGQYPQPGQYPMYGSKPHSGGQKSQHQRGSYRPQNHQSANQDTGYKNQATNHDTGYKSQQESNQGRAKSANETQPNKQEVSKLPNQNASNKGGSSGSQSAEVKTCVVNPFVPLQV